MTVSVILAATGGPLGAGGPDAAVESAPAAQASSMSMAARSMAVPSMAARSTAARSMAARSMAVEQDRTVPLRRITIRGEEREELLPAPLELRDNDVLPAGELRVDEEGVAGLRHEIVEVILHGGIRVDERVVAATVRPPTPTVVSVGTSTSRAATRNWEALAKCESGGDPTIVSRSGRYHGLYQFDLPTWESVGGTDLPSEASPDEQRRRAIMLYEQRGANPWPTCGRRL